MAISAVLLLGGLASTSTAAAGGGATDSAEAARREEARAAFNRGNAAYNLGKYAEAVPEFEKAYALSRLPEILFNLGQCYRKRWEADQRSEVGRRALHYYEALVREAPNAKVRPDAEQFIAELEPAVAAAEARERQQLVAGARGGDALRLAEASFANGQLADAAAILDRLVREPDNGRELLAESYLLRGRVAAALGDPLGAEGLFRRALELRPSAALPDAKGNEAAALEGARKTVAPGGLRLVQAPLGELAPLVPARIDVKIEGDTEKMVAALELSYRGSDGGAFLTARAVPPSVPAIPGVALPPGARVDYYLRALDEHGGVVAESGTPTLPFRLQVASPADAEARAARAPTPWYKRWWVWTLVGAAAVGAGAVTYVETRPDNGLVIHAPVTNQ